MTPHAQVAIAALAWSGWLLWLGRDEWRNRKDDR